MTILFTSRTRPTRYRSRYRDDRGELDGVLDAALIGHLGFVRDGAPVVLPTSYGHEGDTLYLHASSGAGYIDALVGEPVCFTVTVVDAVVYARSAFNHSMNYRSAVIHGTARLVVDAEEKWRALELITDHLAPGSWQHARQPTKRELAATHVLTLGLDEASVKVRTGPPGDEDEDVAAGGRWAGVLPLRTGFEPPQTAPGVDVEVPGHVLDRQLNR